MRGHVTGLGIIGISNLFLLCTKHVGNKTAYLAIFFRVPVDIKIPVDSTEGVGQKNRFIRKGA